MPQIRKMTKAWFRWPDDPHGGEIEIKHLSDGEILDVSGRVQEVSFGDGNPTTRIRDDKTSVRVAVALAAVTGWKNFLDEDGTDLKCTEESKKVFAFGDDEFIPTVERFREELSERVKGDQKAQEKN